MIVNISYKVSKTADLERLFQQQADKLQKYLRIFRPDLVHLKGAIEENSTREGMVVSLNLRLPSGQMATHEHGDNATSAVKLAFEALTEQLKRHEAQLRNFHHWLHRRGPLREEVGTVPFEQTFAAVKSEAISPSDVSGYIDVNLPRLRRYIERQLAYRESQGQLVPGQVAVDDVLSETISNALGEHDDPPERMKLEPWLYRLANQAIDRLSSPNPEEYRVESQTSREEEGDASVLQFNWPNERIDRDYAIADETGNNPEELAARRELISLVETTLRDAGPNEREAFILFTIEGFTLDEIADITNRGAEEVRASIGRAREYLQRVLPVKDPLSEKLVEYSRTA
jgi:RNA polymerase sigma factor (sigma-70 family)